MDNSTHLNEAELRNFYNLVKKESGQIKEANEKLKTSDKDYLHQLVYLQTKLTIYLETINQ